MNVEVEISGATTRLQCSAAKIHCVIDADDGDDDNNDDDDDIDEDVDDIDDGDNDDDVDEGDAQPGSKIANPTLIGCDDYNDS